MNKVKTKVQIRVEKSIEHYDRMIKWAEKLEDKSTVAKREFMFDSLGEVWGSANCNLCQNYRCDYCPLQIFYGRCGASNVLNNWRKLNQVTNWKDWIKEANKMKKQLIEVAKYCE